MRVLQVYNLYMLCRAWSQPGGSFPLKVAGDGPLKSSLQGSPGVEYPGYAILMQTYSAAAREDRSL